MTFLELTEMTGWLVLTLALFAGLLAILEHLIENKGK